jgi:glycosyltransferase involved in cell wall biosynthesis
MRLLHVVPSYLPAVRYGGPIASVHGLCSALAARGHDVHVFTTSVDGDGDSRVPHETPVELDGVAVTYFRSRRLRRLFWAPAMARALREQVSSFDVVHLHSVFLWPTSAAARAARRSGVPYVVAPRGMLVPELIAARSSVAKRGWILVHERRNLRGAAAVHVSSDLERRDYLRCGLDAARFYELPNGITTSDPVDPNAVSPAIRDLAGAGPYVLFLGRLSWKKGIEPLIEAIARIDAVRMVVAGHDDEALRPRLERRAAELGIASRVSFTGAVGGADKAALLEGCVALAAPSSSESFGNVVLEAMAAARPAITTPEVGLAEALVRHDCGVVVPADPGALADAIASLVHDPELAARLGANGRRAALAEYSWDRIAERTEAAYRELTRRPAATAA